VGRPAALCSQRVPFVLPICGPHCPSVRCTSSMQFFFSHLSVARDGPFYLVLCLVRSVTINRQPALAPIFHAKHQRSSGTWSGLPNEAPPHRMVVPSHAGRIDQTYPPHARVTPVAVPGERAAWVSGATRSTPTPPRRLAVDARWPNQAIVPASPHPAHGASSVNPPPSLPCRPHPRDRPLPHGRALARHPPRHPPHLPPQKHHIAADTAPTWPPPSRRRVPRA